jgi:hypothetical protein
MWRDYSQYTSTETIEYRASLEYRSAMNENQHSVLLAALHPLLDTEQPAVRDGRACCDVQRRQWGWCRRCRTGRQVASHQETTQRHSS